ncbi:MAG: RNA polymerase sigma factor [Myxococcales bacterium]
MSFSDETSGLTSTRGQKARSEAEEADKRALLEAARSGDRAAAGRLLGLLLPRARNLVRYLVRSDREVDDLAQEAMVNVLRGLAGFRGEGSVQSWVDRIVVRTVFAHLKTRRQREQGHVEYTPELGAVDNDQASPSFLARRRALRALDGLPDEQRQVLVMHHLVDLEVREIADELQVPFETVRSRLRLGMARLRAALAEREGDTDEPPLGPRRARSL